MNKEHIELGGKHFSYVVTYKPIQRYYFRYLNEAFYVNAPMRAKNHEIVALFKENEQRLLRLVSRKVNQNKIPSPLKLLGNHYSIVQSSENFLLDDSVHLINLDDVNALFTLILPLLQSYVNRRLPIYFDQMYPGNKLPSIQYKRAKGYYGRYQAKKHLITLNANLVLLEDELIDYVIVHELSHIKHMNHQAGFYQFLETILPNYRLLQKRLKKEGVNL